MVCCYSCFLTINLTNSRYVYKSGNTAGPYVNPTAMQKPHPKHPNINRHSGLFFNLGLVISLALVILAFEYKSPFDKEVMGRAPVADIMEVVDIPITSQKPKPPPPPAAPKKLVLTPTAAETELPETKPLVAEVATLLPGQSFALVPDDLPDEIPDEIPYNAEIMPSYHGGMNAFYHYIKQHLRYPKRAKRLGIEGRVTLQFVVDTDGRIREATVIKGIGAGCDEEALRVVLAAPGWQPGRQRGKPVKVRMVVPITFKLH